MGFKMNEKNNVGKVIGFGCLGLIAVPTLITLLSSGGAGSAIPVLVVVGLVVFLIVRSNKKNKDQEPRPIYTLPPTIHSSTPAPSTSSSPIRTATPAPSSPKATGILINPLCNHKFKEETVNAKPVVICDCGNKFNSADLQKFNKLMAQFEKIGSQIDELENQMRGFANGNPVAASQVAQTAAPLSKPVAAPKPITAPVAKPKVSFSLQQWLIIGASLLVLVAGSVFVSTYVNVLDQWVFFAVTTVLAAGMAFASFATRKISGIIASFLSAFSVAMQIATMSIVGDQISNGQAWDFRWDGAPAWWWMITLFVVAGISTLLAKYSSVFGYKGLALLGATGGSLLLGLSVIHSVVPANWALLSLAIMAFAAVGLAYLSKYLRSIPGLEPTDKKFKEYAESVAKREDNSILTFTRIAALIEVVAGLGLALNSLGSVIQSGGSIAPNPFSLLIFAVVVAGVGLSAKAWSGQLSSDGKELPGLLPVSAAIAYISLALSLLSFVLDYSSGWLAAVLTLVVIMAQALVSGSFKKLQPSVLLITLTGYLSAVIWIITVFRNSLDNPPVDLLAWFIIGLAVVVTVLDKRFAIYTNSGVSVALGSIGAIALFANFKATTDIASTSVSYAFIGLLVLLTPYALVILRHFLQAKKDQMDLSLEAWIATVASAGLGLLVSVPNFSETDRDANLLLGLSFAFIVYSAVGFFLSRVLVAAKKFLVAQHYLGQLLSVVVVATTLSSFDLINSPRLFYTAVVAGLVVLNYSIGAIEKQALKLHAGYLLMIGAFFINMWGVQAKWLVTVSAVQFLAIALLTYIHYLMLTKRTEASDSTRFRTVLLGICGSLLFGLAAQWNTWTDIQVASGKDAFLVLLLLAVLSTITLLLSKSKKFSPAAKDILSWLSVSYAAFGVITTVAYVSIYRELDSRSYLAVALVLLSIFTRLKNTKSLNLALVGVFFVSNLVAAGLAGYLLQSQMNFDFVPEFYSLIISLALIVSALLSGNAVEKFKSVLLVDVPVLGSAALSLVYALIGPDNGLNANLREVLGTALITGFALFRLRKNPVQGWIFTSYAAAVGFALASAYTITENWIDFNGPEIYSLLAALAILGVHQVALKHLKLKTTLFSWGLPIGVALLPSTFFTYTAWGVTFTHLGMDQIAREVIALLVSITLLTLGLRRGNLANASMGIAGLALLVVPAVASQSDGLGSAWQIQNTAMAVGILIFAVLAIGRLGGKITGTSRLFLGIPITITLAPALFNALVALAKPELAPMDWWRFGIVLVVALTMLVLGTMREVAGLFYPGLIGVLLTALPYGFKQTQKDQWFLWVLLLLIAGVMVWLALRLERMRKAGRTSSAWLRELK
jgi:outer membrane murein-binding lipoprotein Lpp